MRFDPKDIVEHLRHNLERYPYADGFPVLRELLQNADDARAEAVAVHLLEGWPEAENPLFQGPGLLVVNDGEFDARSAQGMQTFGGSVKALDETAVGRFGLGQKSVFHLCDAFVVVPEGYGAHAPLIINPFATLGRPGDPSLLWNSVADADAARLRAAGAASLPGKRRLNLWLPLRRPDLRPKPKSNGIVASDIAPASLSPLADRQKLAELLAALRNVERVSVVIGAAKADLDRRDAPRMVGYTLEPGDRRFGGPLGVGLASLGRERRATDDLFRDLRQSASWPRTRNRDTDEEEPQKATPHGAVILVNDAEATAELAGDWAVLLPVAEAFPRIPQEGKGRLRLILHGCFFVDSGRKAVIGLNETSVRSGFAHPSDEASIRAAWNRSLRDGLVLPLIPAVLHDTLTEQMLSSEALAAAITALAGSGFGRAHRAAICGKHALARVVERAGSVLVARWRLLPADARLRPLPAPDKRGRVGLAAILPRLADWAEAGGLTLVCGTEAVLTPEPPAWEGEELAELLRDLDPSVFQVEARARALGGLLAVACTDPGLRAAAAAPVLSSLRQALALERSLALHEAIADVLAKVDGAGVVPLPKTASERFVLRALAQASEAVICLPRDWLPLGTGADIALDLHEARPLLAALEPLLQSDRQADAAAAAALAIVRRLERMDHALADPELRSLKVLRASSGAVRTLLSLGELYVAAREARLFKDTPYARKRLNLLAAALPKVQAFILPDVVFKSLEDPGAGRSAPFQAVDLDPAAIGVLVRGATAFGPPAARADLLAEIFTTDAEKRSALRALAAGDRRAFEDGIRLVALAEIAPALDHFLARLLAQSAQEIPVPGAIVDKLDRARQRHLGIAEIAGQELGELLLSHAHELSGHGLDREVAEAILCAGIPVEALRRLSVLPRVDGGWASADTLYRRTPDWPVPHALQTLVPMLSALEDTKAQQQAEALVPPWSPEAQIALCLGQPEPSRFAAEIIEALARVDRPDLDQIGRVPWLLDRHGSAWKPKEVLDLSDEILTAARQGLGDDLPFLPVSVIAPTLRDHPGFVALRDRGVLSDEAGSLDALLLIVEGLRPVAYMGEVDEELAGALTDLAAAGAVLPLPGWPLLAAMLRKNGEAPLETLKAFDVASEEVPDAVASTMNAVAELAESKAAGADVAYRAAFAQIAKSNDSVFKRIMKSIRVCVRTGVWQHARQVAFDTEGVGDEYLLHDDLARFLCAFGEVDGDAIGKPDANLGYTPSESLSQKGSVDSDLLDLVERLRPHFPNDVLVLFAGLVRRTDLVKEQLHDCLGSDRAETDAIWRRIDEAVRVTEAPESGQWFRNRQELTHIRINQSKASTVQVTSLSGEEFEAAVASGGALGVVGNSHRRDFRGTHLNQAQIESFSGRLILTFSGAEIRLIDLKRVARRVLNDTFGLPSGYGEALLSLFDEFDRVEKKSVEQAILAIEDRLPQIVAELKPAQGSPLHGLLREYRRQEKLAQRDGPSVLAQLKTKLHEQLSKSEARKELLRAVRAAMHRHGYRVSSVLFELAQNADDAFLQDPCGKTGQLRVSTDSDKFSVTHWGRLINHLGSEPAKGEEQGWGEDLFNMLLMNLSEKREEVTGRFGLGFKSVHLIAREVGIASGFDASCRITGGMLPEVWAGGKELSYAARREGRRATTIELDIDAERAAEAKKARDAFESCVRWLPATARAIREIEFNGRRFKAHFDETGTTGIRHVVFEGAEPGQALALILGSNTTLFLLLGSDGPLALPETLARLWLLAPLEEECRAGWLLNSYGFRVDPGRGRLAGSVDERAALFGRLGRALGERLVELYDLIERDWAGFAESAGLADRNAASGRAVFLERLSRLFAEDMSRDADDERLETHLHREGGLAHLFREREALPTGLPAPFAPFLRVDQVRWQIAGPLAEQSRLRRLTGWRGIADIAHSAVSLKAAELLQRLGFQAPQTFDAAKLVKAELEANEQVEPEAAARLGVLIDQDFLRALSREEEDALLKAAARAKFRMADGRWGTARLVPKDASDADPEERRILAFAPNSHVADSSYGGAALSFYRLAARQQSEFNRNEHTFARWAQQMTEHAAQCALLAYVVEGSQGERLGSLLASARPHWLPEDPDELRQSALVEGLDDDTRGRLMTILYPSLARSIGSGRWSPFDTGTAEPWDAPPDPAEELARIRDWWRREHTDQRRNYDTRVWPDGFIPGLLHDREATDDRLGWFTFFALGIFRTLPWNNEAAHKSFIEEATQAGWWEEMATARLPDDPVAWLKRLEDFAKPDVVRIDFPQWRRSIADLYALALWLPDYVEAFQLLPRVVERDGRISLSNVLHPSGSEVWQRRGLEGSPLAQSLGLGANWMIREAIRHGLWDVDEANLMHPYAWAATSRLRRMFEDWPHNPIGQRRYLMDLSPEIHGFVVNHLDADAAFLGDLDLPLQLWNGDSQEQADATEYDDETEE